MSGEPQNAARALGWVETRIVWAPGRIDGGGAAGRLGVGAKAGPFGSSSAVRAGPGREEIPGKQGRGVRVPENVQSAFHSVLWVDESIYICFFSLSPSCFFIFGIFPLFLHVFKESIFEFLNRFIFDL